MKQLTKEEFVIKSIEKLRTEKSKGIHVVYTGFNAAFKKQFGEDSRATTHSMAEAGKIVVIPTNGGVRIYKKGEAPAVKDLAADKALAKINS